MNSDEAPSEECELKTLMGVAQIYEASSRSSKEPCRKMGFVWCGTTKQTRVEVAINRGDETVD